MKKAALFFLALLVMPAFMADASHATLTQKEKNYCRKKAEKYADEKSLGTTAGGAIAGALAGGIIGGFAAMVKHSLDYADSLNKMAQKTGIATEELSKLSETAGPGAFELEIQALRDRAQALRVEAYANLDAWQKTMVARHPQRPHLRDYVAGLIDEFVELRGDRKFADDQAIVGGLGRFRGIPVVVMGHEKGHDTTTRLKHNFGMARPEGYRKAVRLMDMAERFGLPVINFIDTAGAYPGVGAEERGQAEAIARSTERCLTLNTPMIATDR